MNPYFVISTYSIPTWITPLAMLVCVSALIPSTSFLGHLCGLSVGYLCECNPVSLSYLGGPSFSASLPFVAKEFDSFFFFLNFPSLLPPRDLLTICAPVRWIGTPKIPCAAREGSPMDRGQVEPSGTVAALCQRRSKDLRTVRRHSYVEYGRGIWRCCYLHIGTGAEARTIDVWMLTVAMVAVGIFSLFFLMPLLYRLVSPSYGSWLGWPI